MLLSLESLDKAIEENPDLKVGCIVDTNIIFANSFPLDHYNEWAERAVNLLHKREVPIFTNLNIRSEFIDLNRRVLIPQGLVDFYEDFNELQGEIGHKLKSLRTRVDKALKNKKTFKFSDCEIKNFRGLLSQVKSMSGQSMWDIFCRDYFLDYIQIIWDKAVKEMKLSFLGTREIESKKYFNQHPKWEDMLNIVGQTGIGTSDAMIINLFLNSTVPMMITADKDVEETLVKLSPEGKVLLTPEFRDL